MRDDLFEILAYCKDIKIRTSIGTNGSLISERNISEIKKFTDTVTVSIDGDKKYFNWVTCSSAYELVIENIKLLHKYKVPFGIHINVTPQNLENIGLLFKKFKNLGSRFVQIGDIQNTRAKSKNELQVLTLSPIQLSILYGIIEDYQIKDKDFIKHVFVAKKNLGAENKWDEKLREYFKPFFVVSPEGSLYPMIDVEEKWVLCKDIARNEISLPKLSLYLSKIYDLVQTTKTLLNKQDVISPYSVINKSL